MSRFRFGMAAIALLAASVVVADCSSVFAGRRCGGGGLLSGLRSRGCGGAVVDCCPTPAPVCTPAPSCGGRVGLLARLRARKSSCCTPEPTCCPAPEPTCCPAPAPTCCPAPAPTCCPAPAPTCCPAPAPTCCSAPVVSSCGGCNAAPVMSSCGGCSSAPMMTVSAPVMSSGCGCGGSMTYVDGGMMSGYMSSSPVMSSGCVGCNSTVIDGGVIESAPVAPPVPDAAADAAPAASASDASST